MSMDKPTTAGNLCLVIAFLRADGLFEIDQSQYTKEHLQAWITQLLRGLGLNIRLLGG
jgi:hypothetical protein